MAFVRKKDASYSWPVTVEVPSDGGRFDKQTFNAVFKRLGRAEFSKFAEAGDVQLLEAVVVGWDGILDEKDKEVPFSLPELRDLADDPFWCKGVIKAYLESLEGGQAKN